MSDRPHNLDLVDDILAGTISRESTKQLLHTADPKGLTPIGYAALSAARDAHSLLELKTLLDPVTPTEQGNLEVMLELLTKIADSAMRQEESQARIEASQARIEAKQERHEHYLRQIVCVIKDIRKPSPKS